MNLQFVLVLNLKIPGATMKYNKTLLSASVINEEWRWHAQQNLLNSVLSHTYLQVSLIEEVLVVVVVLDYVQGSRSQVSAATHHLLLTQNVSKKGVSKQFQEPVLWYRLSRFCQNSVTWPSICTDPGIPKPWDSASFHSRFMDTGFAMVLGQVTQHGNPCLIWASIH